MSTEATAENLAEKGNLEEFDETKNSKGTNSISDKPKAVYLTIDTKKPGKYIYKVRPVGDFVKYRNLYMPYRAKLGEKELATDPAYKNGWYASKKYAINVIDRADGLLKILDKGSSIFKGFADYKSLFAKNPFSIKEGADFAITVIVPADKNGKAIPMDTEYRCTHIQETPLTQAELDMIKAQGLWPLTKIYKPTSLEKRMDMWNALSDSAKIAPKREFNKKGSETSAETKIESASSKPVIEENMAGAPAVSDDLFEDQVTEDKSESAELF